ncbi:MAG: tetratricopeptide repeat protein, partial [Acidobacteria bacterium]|nr:tetratricopeptide repeat protein [Acidobacteriota bacterium]
MAYAQLKKYPEAIKAFLKMTELDPRLAEAHGSLGNLYLMTRDYTAGARSLERSLELKPGLPVRDALAFAYEQLNRIEDAERLRNQPASSQPTNAQQHYTQARDLLRVGKIDEAIIGYQKAISLDPNLVEAHRELAGLYI